MALDHKKKWLVIFAVLLAGGFFLFSRPEVKEPLPERHAGTGPGPCQPKFEVTGLPAQKPDSFDYDVFVKLALRGQVAAQEELARRFAAGDGLQQNWQEAYFWFGVAGVMCGGDPRALEEARGHLNESQVILAEQRVDSWKPEEPLNKTPAPPKPRKN